MNPFFNSLKNKWLIATALIGAIVLCIVINRPHFKNKTLEVGSSSLKRAYFFTEGLDTSKVEVLSDLVSIDLNKIGTYSIAFRYDGKYESVLLFVKDTTAPIVEFTDVFADIDYQFNIDDFILNKSDATQMSVTTDFEGFSGYGVYRFTVSVSDEVNNITSKECTLEINWPHETWQQELGEPLNIENILLKPEYIDRLDMQSCAAVNINETGDYIISGQFDGKTSACVVSVADTTAPTLLLRNIEREGINNYKDISTASFIVSLSDACGKCEWKAENEPDFSLIGTQTISFVATDASGNCVTQSATYTLRPDKTAPVIYSLSTIGVDKHGSCDFEIGVSAVDALEGPVSFSYDASKVNFDAYGTYFVYYSATDSVGNKVTSKRKVEVYHDAEDTQALFDDYYNKNLAGKSAAEMSEIVCRIAYSSCNSDDPIWYGLVNGHGNCYIHAVILDAAYAKAGWGHCIVVENNGEHYWNLCNATGAWRHYDSTPTKQFSNRGPMDNAQRRASWLFQRKPQWDWNESLYPEVSDES